MRLKPDWEEAKERMARWWAGDETDRVVAKILAPKTHGTLGPVIDKTPEKYTDKETVLHNARVETESTFYGAEAFPCHWVYLGPTPLAGLMGCRMNFEPGTVWHSQRFDSWDAVESLAFDPSNRWYRLLKELTLASLQQAQGEYFVSGQGFACVSDVLASLWGTESTLMAMLERPDAVRAAVRRLLNVSKTLYDEFDALVSPYQKGTFDWLRMWAPGRVWSLQSDVCCMISPELFRDFVLWELQAEAEHVDFAFYHLDGPGAITHLDAILGIEALDGIQWVPGAGADPDPLAWIDLFRRIHAAGKKTLISCPPARIKPLLEKVNRRLTFLAVSCKDVESAETALSQLDRIGT